MKTNEFDRWAELVDREAVGETLSQAEKEFCWRYESQNAKCRAELEFWRRLGDIETEPDEKSREVVDRALAALEPEAVKDDAIAVGKPSVGRQTVNVKWLFAAAAVAVAGVVFGLKPGVLGLMERRAPRVGEGASSRIELVYVSGQVLVGGKPGNVGQRLLTEGNELEVICGSACIAIDPGIDVCLGERGRLKLTKIIASDRTLDLFSGRLTAVLKPLPKGTTFSVGANGTVVTAVGTAFSVEVTPENGEVETTVLAGKVSLGVDGTSRHIVAHQQAVVRGSRSVVSSVVRSKESRHWALVQPAELWQQASTAILDLPAVPGHAKVVLDGQPIGIAPLASLIPSGGHVLEVQVNGRTVVERTFTAEAGQSTKIDLGLAMAAPACQNFVEGISAPAAISPATGDSQTGGSIPPAVVLPSPDSPPAWFDGSERREGNGRKKLTAVSPSSRSVRGLYRGARTIAKPVNDISADMPTTGLSVSSAEELIRRARASMQAHHWVEAADAYRDLTDAFPDSSEARVVLVSLGQIELHHLGQAEMALQRFDRYLKYTGGGALAQEARYARIGALKSLGQTSAETAAIQEFLKLYPESFETKVLRERLRTVNGSTE